MHRALKAAFSLLLAVATVAPVCAAPRRAPSATGPAAGGASVTPDRVALLSQAPQDVAMVPNAVGWVKECGVAAQARDCTIGTGFALAADTPENLLLKVTTSERAGNHMLQLTAPVDVALRPGFTLVLDDGEAVLGDYTTCGAKGCRGEVTLSDPIYRRLVGAKAVRVVIGNARDASLRLSLPLDGFAQAAAGAPTPLADLASRREAAAARIKAARAAQ